MNKKTALWIFIFLLIVTGILLVIKNFNKIKKVFTSEIKTKEDAIKYLMTVNPTRNADKLQSYDEAYLIAWANGDKLNEVTFDHNGKTYYTATGTAKR